jgi:hypothetical protein
MLRKEKGQRVRGKGNPSGREKGKGQRAKEEFKTYD